MSTHMHTQPTQIEPELSTQEPTQNKQKETTQQPDLDTQMLIHALKEQYESRIQDLKEILQSKEKEIERISALFNQHQQLEMARVSKLPAKTNNYPEAEAVEDQPTPSASEPPLSAESIPEPLEPEPGPKKKKRWWQF